MTTISVCVDCMFVHANGETSGTPDREPLSLIGADTAVSLGMTLEEHGEECQANGSPVDDCECEQLGFSWCSCQGCGSALAGDRYAMTLY